MPFAWARLKTREASAAVEAANVDVGNPRIAAIGLARRPTHQLHTRVSGSFAQGEYFFQRKVGDDGAHKTELHDLRFYCAIGFTYTIQKPSSFHCDRGKDEDCWNLFRRAVLIVSCSPSWFPVQLRSPRIRSR